MGKRLIVHMGVHRTGTTAIQETLKKNRSSLLEQGVLYPRLFGEDAHIALPGRLKKRRLSAKMLREEIKKADTDETHTVILSAEDFCTLKRFTFLRELQKEFDVEVVLYLRRQTEWLESWYNQHIKWPWDRRFSSISVEKFLKKSWRFYWMDYYKLLRRIERVVPRDNICVKTMEAQGVVDSGADFFAYAGIDVQRLDKAEEANASLTSMQIEVLRHLDLIDRDSKERWKLISALKQMRLAGDDGSKIILNDAQAEKIAKRFARSNRLVAQHYFGRSALFMDAEKRQRAPRVPEKKTVRERYIPELLKKAGLA